MYVIYLLLYEPVREIFGAVYVHRWPADEVSRRRCRADMGQIIILRTYVITRRLISGTPLADAAKETGPSCSEFRDTAR